MRTRRRITLIAALTVTIVTVFAVGYASALGTQQQGVPQKTYVAANPTFTISGVLGSNWMPVPQLQVIGTWHPGDLLIAHVDAGTTCVTTGGVASGQCRIRIGLTGPDPEAPNIEFQPTGADTFAMDTATGPTEAGQAHGVTRYLTVPSEAAQPGAPAVPTPIVWVEVKVSDPTIRFTLDLAVLTVEVVKPTVT